MWEMVGKVSAMGPSIVAEGAWELETRKKGVSIYAVFVANCAHWYDPISALLRIACPVLPPSPLQQRWLAK